MKILVVGLGKVGAALCFALINNFRDKVIRVYVNAINRGVFLGEKRYLLEAAILLGSMTTVCGKNAFSRNDRDPVYDYVLFCAGHARSMNEKDEELFFKNKDIVTNFLKKIKAKKVFMITNPPEQLAMLARDVIDAEIIPIGSKLDKARKKMGYPGSGHILNYKGYTNWGVIGEVISRIEKESE